MVHVPYRRVLTAAMAALLLAAPVTAAAGESPAPATPAPIAPIVDTKPIPASGAPAQDQQSAAISKEQALAIIRRHFTVPEGPGTLDAFYNNRGQQAVWEISYNVATENGSSGYGIGTVDAKTGRILRFNLAAPNLLPPDVGPLKPARPEAEARAKAWALVTEMYPEESESLRPAPSVFGADYPYYGIAGQYNVYSFTWYRYHDDVPFLGSMVRVQVDRETLDYVSLEANLQTDTRFQSGLATLTPAEAMARFRAEYRPTLTYQAIPTAKSIQSPELKLVYSMQAPGLLDAVSGKFVDSSGKEVPAYTPAEALPAATGTSVTPGPLPLTEESALAFARVLLAPPAGGQLSAPPMYGGEPGLLNVQYFGQNGGAGVSLDPKTGLIRNAYRKFAPPAPAAPAASDASAAPSMGSTPPAPPKAQVPDPAQLEKAKQIAIDLVQRYFSPIADHLKLQPQGVPPFYYSSTPQLNFTFQRYENGIPVGGNLVQVGISPDSMDWIFMSSNWTEKLTLPDLSQAMAPAQALEKYLAGRQAVMVWVNKYDPTQQPMYGPYGTLSTGEAMLVFQLVAPDRPPYYSLLDAVTGAEIDPTGGQLSLAAADKLLAGNRAEGELRYMLACGALPADQLNPEAAMTRGQALQLLTRGLQGLMLHGGGPMQTLPYTDVTPGTELYYLVSEAYRWGLLVPEGEKPVFGADQPMTRAEFASWMVRELKLGALARSGLKTESGFGDLTELTPEGRNGVAFLEALGILVPDKAFRGSDPLTQADGAAWTVQLILYHARRVR